MKILTNSNSVFGEIEKVVENSKEFIYIVSPFIKSEIKNQISYVKFRKAIELAIKKGTKVNFISKQPDSQYKGDPEKKLKEFTDRGCKLYLVPNLHTKVYCNESKALITSMNLYMHSVINNEEIGVRISRRSDTKEFEKLLYYIYKLKLKSNKSEEIKQEPPPEIEKVDDLQGKDNEYIYVLKLKNNKWWVGKSKNPSTRILAHKDGMGSSWTRENRVIETEEVLENGDLTEITLSYMKKYEWQNVQGSSWYGNQLDKYIPVKILNYINEQKKLKPNDDINVENDEKYLVCVLRLENDKWWVGKTNNIKRTLKKIRNGKGSPWTVINRLIKLEELRENADLKEVTLEYMRNYGWENVRGYAWSQWNMKNPPKELRL